jgi:hypothetical protein
MSIALDGFEVLRLLGKHAALFGAIRADVDKAARALVVKALKAKTLDLAALRAIARALEGDPIELVLEGLGDADVTALLGKVDKYHPELKTSAMPWRRKHLKALAEGLAEPVAAPLQAAKPPAEPTRLRSDVMDVFRDAEKRKR